MEAVTKFFSAADWPAWLAGGLMLFICAVPFVDLISSFRPGPFKKGK